MASTISVPTADRVQLADVMEILEIIPAITAQDLKTRPLLWYKIHVFVYDLRNFREIPGAQARLDSIVDASYLGLPYFKPDEVQLLKSTVAEGNKTLERIIEETLNERLERRLKKRQESEDFRVCAAHDLAPIFEKVFAIKPKDLARNVDFLAVLAKSGLDMKDGDEWIGIPKKSFQKKNKRR